MALEKSSTSSYQLVIIFFQLAGRVGAVVVSSARFWPTWNRSAYENERAIKYRGRPTCEDGRFVLSLLGFCLFYQLAGTGRSRARSCTGRPRSEPRWPALDPTPGQNQSANQDGTERVLGGSLPRRSSLKAPKRGKPVVGGYGNEPSWLLLSFVSKIRKDQQRYYARRIAYGDL